MGPYGLGYLLTGGYKSAAQEPPDATKSTGATIGKVSEFVDWVEGAGFYYDSQNTMEDGNVCRIYLKDPDTLSEKELGFCGPSGNDELQVILFNGGPNADFNPIWASVSKLGLSNQFSGDYKDEVVKILTQEDPGYVWLNDGQGNKFVLYLNSRFDFGYGGALQKDKG